MRQTRAIELGTGLFVLLGFAALFFLVTQITNREFGLGDDGYRLTRDVRAVGGLKPGAPVSMSGVTIGRVESIAYDFKEYRARGHAAHRAVRTTASPTTATRAS